MSDCKRCNGSGYASMDKEFDSIAPTKETRFINAGLFQPCPVCHGTGTDKEDAR